MSSYKINNSWLILESVLFVKFHLKPDFEFDSKKKSVQSSLISFEPYLKVITKSLNY